MAINPVSTSNSVHAAQTARPQQSTSETQRVAAKDKHDRDTDNTTSQATTPNKPTVNSNGHTIGTTLNITA